MSRYIHVYILADGDVVTSNSKIYSLTLTARQELLITSVEKGCIIDVLKDRYGNSVGKQFDIGGITT